MFCAHGSQHAHLANASSSTLSNEDSSAGNASKLCMGSSSSRRRFHSDFAWLHLTLVMLLGC
jgi:hypothetical protein